MIRWYRPKDNARKGLWWRSEDWQYQIRRGIDNNAELLFQGDVVHKGTEDECKRAAEKHHEKNA